MHAAPGHRRRLLVVATAALVLAGCNSGDSASSTTPPASTSPSTTVAATTTTAATTATTTTSPATTVASPTTEATTTTLAPAAAGTTTSADDPDDPFASDKALARAALLTIDDFPEGWIEEPEDDASDDDGTADEFQQQFDACLGVDGVDSVGDQLDGREVTTGEFTPDAGITTVSQEVLLADDETMAIAAMNEVGVDGAPSCMADTLQSFFESELATNPEFAASFPEGMTVGVITVERLESAMDPTVAVEYLVTMPLVLDGDVLDYFLDVVYFRQGRALSQVQFQSFGGRFDPEGIGFLGGETLTRLEVIGG